MGLRHSPNNFSIPFPHFFILYSLFFILYSFLFFSSHGQTTTSSPYSVSGIGDLESAAFSPSSGMGNAKYAIAYPYSINIANPASYGIHPLPTFDVGFTSNFLSLAYDDSLQKVNKTYFKNMAIAIPVSKRWWASCFGIVPYSKMGYSYSAKDTVNGFGEVSYSYRGEGGISRFFLGNTFNIFKDSLQFFSVGVNASYLFGSITKTSRVIPQTGLNAFNTKIQHEATIGDFLFDAGILYSKKINNWNFSLGADYEFSGKLNTSGTSLVTSFVGSGFNEENKDTISLDTLDNSIVVPAKLGAGLSVFFNNRWLFAADYSTQDWSQLETFGKNAGLKKQDQISVGIQYNYNAKERENFFKMLSYRTGFRYANTPISVMDKQLREYGITFGVGMPIGEKTKGSFNLSLETGIRGEKNNSLIREQFTNIIFGFSFTPSFYDRWFVKPKID